MSPRRHKNGLNQTNNDFLAGSSRHFSCGRGVSSGRKRLLWRQRGLMIRRELLGKAPEYEGLQQDTADCERQLAEVQDLLRQAA